MPYYKCILFYDNLICYKSYCYSLILKQRIYGLRFLLICLSLREYNCHYACTYYIHGWFKKKEFIKKKGNFTSTRLSFFYVKVHRRIHWSEKRNNETSYFLEIYFDRYEMSEYFGVNHDSIFQNKNNSVPKNPQ